MSLVSGRFRSGAGRAQDDRAEWHLDHVLSSQDRRDGGSYGGEIADVMTYFTSLYGLPPKKNLTVIETEDGAPKGYSAPGLLFFLAGRSAARWT